MLRKHQVTFVNIPCNWDKHAQSFGTVSLKYRCIHSLAYCKEHNWYRTNVPSVYMLVRFTYPIALVYINSIHDFFTLL